MDRNGKLFATMLMILALLGLAACGGGGGGSGGTTAASPEPPTDGGGADDGGGDDGTAATLAYVVVDTGQATFYDLFGPVAEPDPDDALRGQDAGHAGNGPACALSADGLTVDDLNTGLTWQRSPDTDGDGDIDAADKLAWSDLQDRPAALNARRFGGYDDWRLPSIKELYSLIDFRGVDPSGLSGSDTSGLTPFLDTDYFEFGYGDTGAGERIIDAQFASDTLYAGEVPAHEGGKLFGVNFADGRIKGYGLSIFGVEKTFYVICVRGNPAYGRNDLVAGGDGTVTDRATGLMWSQADSGIGMDWEEALEWVALRNAAGWLGHDDWRLPDAKELQSIVDYTRSPSGTGTAAIDPVFVCTRITAEDGAADYPAYWTGTTHANGGPFPGGFAAYVCFGRAMGCMDGVWQDVHGAGAQRSDPKFDDGTDYSTGHGPQGDAVRIENFVRLVRDAD